MGDEGFDPHYNIPVAVDQGSLLALANTVSQHAPDKQEAVPTLDAIDERVGQPEAVALDNGYFSESHIARLEERQTEPYIAAGRERHHRSWRDYFAQRPQPPAERASAKEKMARIDCRPTSVRRSTAYANAPLYRRPAY
jgi:hypothetical protein